MPPKRKGNLPTTLVILAIIFSLGFVLVGGVSLEPQNTENSQDLQKTPGTEGLIQTVTPGGQGNTLQLGQIPFITVTPSPTEIPTTTGSPLTSFPTPTISRTSTVTPTRSLTSPTPGPKTGQQCNEADPINTGCTCSGINFATFSPFQWSVYCPYRRPNALYGEPKPPFVPYPGQVFHRPEHEHDPDCQVACIAKPVIYLYPEKTMNVDVSIVVPGKIVKSDPLYPLSGWKNIEAHPDGTLFYHNEKYKELFYESAVDQTIPPSNGIVIKTVELEKQLKEITTRLGLSQTEQEEFLNYWLPELQRLQSPYILFSILDQKEKERVDSVSIKPTPDTFISFIAYFKPLSLPIIISPLKLPDSPPKRIGFTAVEWGGTIDLSN